MARDKKQTVATFAVPTRNTRPTVGSFAVRECRTTQKVETIWGTQEVDGSIEDAVLEVVGC